MFLGWVTWMWELSPLARETGQPSPSSLQWSGGSPAPSRVPLPGAVWCHSSDPVQWVCHGAASGSSPPPLPQSHTEERGGTFLEPVRWDLLSFVPPTPLAKRAQRAQPLDSTEANQGLAGTCFASWKERTESRDPRGPFLPLFSLL